MASTPLKSIVQGQAYQLVFLQLAVVAGFAFFISLIKDSHEGVSVLLGGLAYVLPNLLFVWRVFRYAGTAQMVQFLTAFFVGEMLKLILGAILFLVIVKYLPVSLLSVLAGYIGAIVAFWMVSFWLFSKKNGRSASKD